MAFLPAIVVHWLVGGCPGRLVDPQAVITRVQWVIRNRQRKQRAAAVVDLAMRRRRDLVFGAVTLQVIAE